MTAYGPMGRCLMSLVILCGLVWSGNAKAQTPCTGGITDLNFGTVSGLNGTTVDAAATISVTCTANFDILACVHLGRGDGGGFGGGQRRLRSGGNRLNFEFYSDAARTQVWRTIGNVSNAQGTVPIIIPAGNTVTRTQTIYGRLTLTTAQPGPYIASFVADSDVVVQGDALANLSAAQRRCDRTHNYAISMGFDVTTDVASYCDVSGGTLDFGTSGPITANLDAAGSLTVGCTNGTTYAVSLDNGQNAVGAQRRMVSGGNVITYDLYTDAVRTQPWQGSTTATATGTGNTVTIPVYGRIPPQAGSAPGVYSDTVVVTMTY